MERARKERGRSRRSGVKEGVERGRSGARKKRSGRRSFARRRCCCSRRACGHGKRMGCGQSHEFPRAPRVRPHGGWWWRGRKLQTPATTAVVADTAPREPRLRVALALAVLLAALRRVGRRHGPAAQPVTPRALGEGAPPGRRPPSTVSRRGGLRQMWGASTASIIL